MKIASLKQKKGTIIKKKKDLIN